MTQFVQRWGTFSVHDHLSEAPFVSEVLLYDQLVIPVLNPNDPAVARWNPERQAECLEILKVKTDEKDGLALCRFQQSMSNISAIYGQRRSL